MYMKAKKCKDSGAGGRLFIVCPTLDMMLSSCDNVKMIADIGGIDYSNFIKTCKMEKDLRFSSYEKCATAFGKDTLIMHLPCGMIDSIVDAKSHMNNRCRIIHEKDLIRILHRLFKTDNTELLLQFELLLLNMEELTRRKDIKKLIIILIRTLKQIMGDYGNS